MPRPAPPVPFGSLFEHSLVVNASMMVVPKTLEVYGRGSYIWGEFREPWDLAGGLNWYPFNGNRNIRLNNELAYVYKAPVGAQSYPWQVGLTGIAFSSNFEVLF